MSRIHNYPHLPPLRISVPSGSDQTLCLSLVSYTKGTIEFFRRSILNHRPRHLGICFSPRQCIGNTVHLFPVATTALPLARLTSHRPLARLRREARATGKDTVPCWLRMPARSITVLSVCAARETLWNNALLLNGDTLLPFCLGFFTSRSLDFTYSYNTIHTHFSPPRPRTESASLRARSTGKSGMETAKTYNI
jgi:hypothetical protein